MNKKRAIVFVSAGVKCIFSLFFLFLGHLSFAGGSFSKPGSGAKEGSGSESSSFAKELSQPVIAGESVTQSSRETQASPEDIDNSIRFANVKEQAEKLLSDIDKDYSGLDDKIKSLKEEGKVFGDEPKNRAKGRKNEYLREIKDLENKLSSFSSIRNKVKEEFSKEFSQPEGKDISGLTKRYEDFVKEKMSPLAEKIASINEEIHKEKGAQQIVLREKFLNSEKEGKEALKKIVSNVVKSSEQDPNVQNSVQALELANVALMSNLIANKNNLESSENKSDIASQAPSSGDSSLSRKSSKELAAASGGGSLEKDSAFDEKIRSVLDRLSDAAKDVRPYTLFSWRKNGSEGTEKHALATEKLAKASIDLVHVVSGGGDGGVGSSPKEKSSHSGGSFFDAVKELFSKKALENPVFLEVMENNTLKNAAQTAEEIAGAAASACASGPAKLTRSSPFCAAHHKESEILKKASAELESSLPSSRFAIKEKLYSSIGKIQDGAGKIFSKFKSLGNLFKSKTEEEKFNSILSKYGEFDSSLEERKAEATSLLLSKIKLSEKEIPRLTKEIFDLTKEKEDLSKQLSKEDSEVKVLSSLIFKKVLLENEKDEKNKEKLKGEIIGLSKKADIYRTIEALGSKISPMSSAKNDLEDSQNKNYSFFYQQMKDISKRYKNFNKKVSNLNNLMSDLRKAEDKAQKNLDSKRAALSKNKDFKKLSSELIQQEEEFKEKNSKYFSLKPTIKRVTDFGKSSITFINEDFHSQVKELDENMIPSIKKKIDETQHKISLLEKSFLVDDAKSELLKIQAKKKDYREKIIAEIGGSLIDPGTSSSGSSWSKFSGWFKSLRSKSSPSCPSSPAAAPVTLEKKEVKVEGKK